MGKYLFQVLLTVAFWACVVWFGLPVLKKYAPGSYNHLTRFFLNEAKLDEIVSDVVVKAEQAFKSISPPATVLNKDPIDQEDTNSSPVMQNDEETPVMRPTSIQPSSVKKETETPDHASKQAILDPTPASIASAKPTIEDDPLSALNDDPGYGWGLVVTNAFIYDVDMKRIGIFPAGTVVSRKDSELKMNGYVSECFYLRDRKWAEKTVFLYDSDLVRFETTYEEAGSEQRNLLIAYCKTLAKYEEIKTEAYKKAIRKNPHFNAYKTAMETHNAFFAKANAAKAQFDQSEGMQRSQLMDQLRKYKAEEAAIIRHYQEVKKQYDAWKSEHIGDDKDSKIARTVEMQSLENALDSMRPQVHLIAPGL